MTGPPSLRRMLLVTLYVAAIAVAVVGIMTARVLVEGERELLTAEQLAAAGKLEEAASHARAAAAWYAPGAPHVSAAYRRLVAVAQVAEAKGDVGTALFAWKALRAAVLSSRWIVVPAPDELALANASIARLSSTQRAASAAQGTAGEELQAQLVAGLLAHPHPRAAWIVVLTASFVAMTSGLLHMAVRGAGQTSDFQWARMRAGGVLALVGAAGWVLALLKA